MPKRETWRYRHVSEEQGTPPTDWSRGLSLAQAANEASRIIETHGYGEDCIIELKKDKRH